jgi:hypothetical protein
MERFTHLVAILAAVFVLTTPALANAPDAKDFPIKVHVTSSEVRPCGLTSPYYTQCLAVLIDAKKYELACITGLGGLKLPIHTGDYQARLVKDEAKEAGEFDRKYEILFADGKTAKYSVVGEFE